VRVVILRMSQLQVLDATGARVITEMVHALERRGITVLIKGIQPGHLRVATRVGVVTSLRHQNHLFTELPAAVEHARNHIARGATAADLARNIE
jgi:sulfate permease, SulP family